MTKQLLEIVETIPNWVRLQDDDIVLDIGCNDGFTLSLPRTIGWETTGIDPSNVIGLYFKEIFSETVKYYLNNKYDWNGEISWSEDVYNPNYFFVIEKI